MILSEKSRRQQKKIKNFSLAEELNRHNIIPDIVAYRHLIKTGNFRTLSVTFVDFGKSPPVTEASPMPRAIVYLGDKIPKNFIPEAKGVYDIVGVLQTHGLKAMAIEALAIRNLLSADHRLQEDIAAKKEMERQLQFTRQQIDDTVSYGIRSGMVWKHKNQTWDSIQAAASEMMEKAYSKGFILHNELINRDRSSGAITAALRALCAAMVESADKENLHIEKHPPHLLIYKSFLQKKELHAWNGEKFCLTFDSRKISNDLHEVIKKMEEILFSNNPVKPLNMQNDILNLLALPPYGVKQATALILCVVCMLYHKDKLALYENNAYVHIWGRKTLERFWQIRLNSHFPRAYPFRSMMPCYPNIIMRSAETKKM